MMISRRSLIRAGAAFGLGGVPLSRVWAQAELSVGGFRIDSVSDGSLVLPTAMILGDAPEAEAAEILARYGIAGPELRPDCNLTLLRDGTNTVLFDAGSGANFMASAGRLQDALAAIDVAPEEITHVILTHGHPDHLWGVLDDFDDPAFPEATYLIGRAERDYWLDPATVDTIGAERQAFAAGALRYLAGIEDRLESFDDGDEVLPGVLAVLTPGHTPGHMSFELRDGSDALFLTGDAIGNHHVAFERPDWRAGSDQDADLGASTRVALLDRLAGEQMPIIGFHLPAPGLGRVERQGDGYLFVPQA
jgi:glyoxylase-like metal-dependent hydrolase (beta-lactamase superfamily II)